MLPKTYLAARIVAAGQLELVHCSMLVPEAGEVLVRVEACGMCGADISDIERPLSDGEVRMVPGHEVVGRIVGLGSNVSDLWQIGKRVGVGRLGGHCGECMQCRTGQFQLCPNQPFVGSSRDGGYAEYMLAKSSGLIAIPDELDALKAAPLLCAGHLAEGAAFYSCIDWRSVDLIMAAGKLAGLRHSNTIIWNKGSGSNGSPYRPAHELIVMFVKGSKLAVNNVEMGKHGRDRTNVWSYPGANQRGSSAAKALEHHPTPKPIEMVEDALKDVSKRGALVLDVFLGSGTTLLAAERSGRRAHCIELDPAYVDVAIRRWEAMTGKEAIHAGAGKTFAQMVIERETPAQNYAA